MNENKNVPELRFPGFEGEWGLRFIGSVLTIGSGKDYKHLGVGDVPVYGTGGYMLSVNDYLYDGKSVCIGRKGTIDKPRFVEGKFWTVDTLFYTHSYKNSVPEFVYGVFQKINWQKYNEASGVPSLSKTTIEKIKIYLPVVEEQQKIADFLSAVDKKIEQLTEKHRLFTEYKKGVMQQIFSQQIRFKDDEGNEYPEWEEKKLGDICIKKSSTIAANAIEDSKGVFKIYGASGELESVDFYDEETPYVAIVKDGAGVGRVQYCEAKSSVLGTLDKIFPVSGVQLTFLYEVLKGISFEKYTTGSTIPHIYFKDYKKELIGLPTGEEQQKIADFLTAIDKKIDQALSKIEQTKAFKKGLLQRLFV